MRANVTTGKAVAERPAKLTFDDLVALERRLAALEDDILTFRRPRLSHWTKLRAWYRRFRPRLVKLVGWRSGHARDSILGGSEAYTVAYRHLCDTLMYAKASRPNAAKPKRKA